MVEIKKVVLLIPCYNEEKGIGLVLDSIPQKKLKEMGYEIEALVIDNNSRDATARIALSKGARVICEKRQGKGHALLTGFKMVPSDAHFVAMIDGDGSYHIRELPRLLEPLESGFGDAIVGTRLHGRLSDDSMTSFNRLGNWLFTFLARVGYKTNVTDVCSGFFVWKREVVDDLARHVESDGFSIEMEMIAKMARMDYDCYSMPITYTERNGTSSLRPFKDGVKILHAWGRNLWWRPEPASPEYSLVDKNKERVPLSEAEN